MVLFDNSGRKARLIGTALLIITFVAGALAGAAAIRVLSAEKPETTAREAAPRDMRGGPRRLLLDSAFTREIALTDDQRVRIKAILDRRDAEAKQMWQSFEPRLKQFSQQVHDEIQTVLTPEQQQKLDAAIAQKRAAKKHRCAPDSTHKHHNDSTKERRNDEV